MKNQMSTPAEEAMRIVEAHIPIDCGIDRIALADAIRWAIIRGQIAARQPLNITPEQVPAIVYQIVSFVEDYGARLHAASYCKAANELEACRRLVLAIHGIQSVERKPVGLAVSSKATGKAARA